MSYPYPQDRHRDRKEKGEQPYQDAKEAFAETEAQVQAEAEYFGETDGGETEEERNARHAAEMAKRLREVGEEIAEDAGVRQGETKEPS